MEKELSFPLERSPAMKLMGWIWTGSIPGQLIVGVLIIISVLFVGSENFSNVSIIFTLVFIFPITVYIHFRLVRRSKKLMEGWCDVKFFEESQVLEYKTGFPNTMNPKVQEVEITDKNRDIWINGGEIGGYSLRLGNPSDKRKAVRLGLWVNLDDAEENAKKLQEWLNGKIQFELSKHTEEDLAGE